MAAMDITSDFKDLKSKRENLVFMARTAESAERYEDMCKVMKVRLSTVSARVCLCARELL